MSQPPPIRVERLAEGVIWRVALATPKANLLDMKTIDALTATFEEASGAPALKAILFEGEGPSFSYGASVAEHLPGIFETMIPAFGRLFMTMLDSGVVCVAAVRGQCLGGGMELASFCHRVVVSPDARMGQPEINLGVIAPVASAILGERVGQKRAEELLLSGRILKAPEALAIGLADAIADDPAMDALGWIRENLLTKSASSLRLACVAARAGYARRLKADLPWIEKLYTGRLMRTADAVEGLVAFTESRPPVWRNR